LALLIASLLFTPEIKNAMLIKQSSRVTQGIIIRVRTHREVDYQFSLNGKTYSGHDVFPGSVPATDGTTINVFFAQSNPDINQLSEPAKALIESSLLALEVFAMLVCGLMFVGWRFRVC